MKRNNFQVPVKAPCYAVLEFRKMFFCFLTLVPLFMMAQPGSVPLKNKSQTPPKKSSQPVPKKNTASGNVTKNVTNSTLNVLDSILLQNKKLFADILAKPTSHKVQVIYTQINRDAKNKATFVNHTFRLNKADFFYPASMVKLPVCALSFEKLEELKKTGVTPHSTMLTGKGYACQTITNTDTTAANGLPSVAQYIKRILIVSDNTAYSRLFEFLTPEYIYRRLYAKGYPTARIRIRFDVPCLGKPNNYSNPIQFLNDSGRIIYKQPAKYFAADKLLMPVKNTTKYIDFSGPDISVRKDFSHSNFLSLQDMHDMLKAIMFPNETPPEKGFHISMQNRQFLWKYLQMFPVESEHPSIPNREHYIDSYKKYLFYGQDSQQIENKNIRIFNVVGQSYGYTTDCAYIVDFENNIEFLLTATYYVQNYKGVIDGTDQTYNNAIMPFFKNLGQLVYQYELQRNRKYSPNLLQYKF